MSNSGSKVCLHVLNAVIALFALIIAATSIWFFVQVQEFTNLRNANHYLLDYNVYWPQAIPWIFFLVGVFVAGVCFCGFTGVSKNRKGLLRTYKICMGVVIILLIGAAIIALVFADSKLSDDFIKDTVWDAFTLSKNDDQVAAAFGVIEKKLHCCGADSPRDYRVWKNEFPTSCCDEFYHGWIGSYQIDCDLTNKLANERHGCMTVASWYARVSIRALSGAAIFTALLCVISLIVAIALSRVERSKRPVVVAHYETESKKVLL